MLLLINCEARLAKYSDRSFDVWTEWNEKNFKLWTYVPSGMDNWLTRALFYSYHELVGKLSGRCRKIFRKLVKYHSKPIFCENQVRSISRKISQISGNFQWVLGKFPETVTDSYWIKYPTILDPNFLQVYLSKLTGASWFLDLRSDTPFRGPIRLKTDRELTNQIVSLYLAIQ